MTTRFHEDAAANGGKAASQAYWNALSKLKAAWREVTGEELPANGSRAKEAFEQALEQVKDRLRHDAAGKRRLKEILDVDVPDEIVDVLLDHADLDDLTPNHVIQAMIDECRRRGRGRVDLRTFLRSVLDVLFTGEKTRRPNVGPNRHWPRLLQYIRELEYRTDWSPVGRGVQLANRGGRGPVARDPRDPRLLSLRIDPDFL